MFVRELSAALEKHFGTKNCRLKALVDPVLNPDFGVQFLMPGGSVANADKHHQNADYEFYESLAGPFYRLELVGLAIKWEQGCQDRMPVWKDLIAVGRDAEGKLHHSTFFPVKCGLKKLEEFAINNRIRWYCGNVSFPELVNYVEWLKCPPVQSTEGGGT